MRSIKYICPTCGLELEEVSEHLEKTDTQPEFESIFWCERCQEEILESEAERIEW